jgi:hypothetical protein
MVVVWLLLLVVVVFVVLCESVSFKNEKKRLRERRQKLDEENKKCLCYKSGMAGPHASKTYKNKEGAAVNNKQVIRCSHCKSDTHQRRNRKLCAINPKNIAAKENVYENAKSHEGKCDTVSYHVLSK